MVLKLHCLRSFVCDVNGWSFVKNSKRYYDDSAGILRRCVSSTAVVLYGHVTYVHSLLIVYNVGILDYLNYFNF